MHKLAFISSGKILVPSNGTGELIRALLFRDLDDNYPNRTVKIQASVAHRFWMVSTNAPLANLLTDSIGEDIWVKDLFMIRQV